MHQTNQYIGFLGRVANAQCIDAVYCSTFIPLPKKGNLKQCANYGTIALVSHASKILLRIILERMRVKTETEIADEHIKQAGFRQKGGQETKSRIPEY